MFNRCIFALNKIVMTFSEWINKVIDSGNLCAEYTVKVKSAKSKRALMDICLDSNGSKFLQEMDSKGFMLPYETIMKEFGSFINGRYVAEYEGRNRAKYTSVLYCCYDESLCEVETTIITLLGCNTTLKLKENSYTFVYADKNCNLVIDCPQSARCKVERWGGATIDVIGCESNVDIKSFE